MSNESTLREEICAVGKSMFDRGLTFGSSGNISTLAEAAAMIDWIVSPECSFTTGFAFDLSGGRAVY